MAKSKQAYAALFIQPRIKGKSIRAYDSSHRAGEAPAARSLNPDNRKSAAKNVLGNAERNGMLANNETSA